MQNISLTSEVAQFVCCCCFWTSWLWNRFLSPFFLTLLLTNVSFQCFHVLSTCFGFFVSEFLREEVIVLLAAQFVTFFNQTALEVQIETLIQIKWSVFSISFLDFFFLNHFKPCESIQTKFYLANKHNETKGFNGLCPQTMVTPLTQKYFSFGELENSVMYFLGGVVVIAGFLFVRWLSRHVTERVILAIGLCMCNISCIWCLIFLAKPLG